MTASHTPSHQRIRAVWQPILGFLTLFFLLLLLRNTAIAATYMTRGLQLCAHTVIPSIFPFMVLSEWLVTTGTAERWLSPVCIPLRRLLRLPCAGCCAVLLGLLCGFPVNIRYALEAYRCGRLTKRECERAIAASSVPSSAFVVGAVGTSLWGDARLGAVLYGEIVLSALLIGFLAARTAKSEVREEAPFAAYARLSPTLLTGAVRTATQSTLLICAYVVFFSTLTGTVTLALSEFDLPPVVPGALTALLEMSSGASVLAALPHTPTVATLTACALAWSGLSVHCQAMALCDGSGISLRPYFAAKVLQAVLSALILSVLLHASPTLLPSPY